MNDHAAIVRFVIELIGEDVSSSRRDAGLLPRVQWRDRAADRRGTRGQSRTLTNPPRRGGGNPRPRDQSIEHVPLVEFNTVQAEQPEQGG